MYFVAAESLQMQQRSTKLNNSRHLFTTEGAENEGISRLRGICLGHSRGRANKGSPPGIL
jgi:hypothetical protein